MPTRTVVQSGLWSNPATWQGGNVPQDGDDVVHGAQFTVVLNTNTPQLGNYQLNGALLFRHTGGVRLRVTSLSGSGVLDLNNHPNPANATILPCWVEGIGNAPLDLTTLSSVFNYYGLIFSQTLHASFWSIDYLSTARLYPYITNKQVSGNDLILTVAAEPNTPAAHFLSNNNNAIFLAMLPTGTSQQNWLTVYYVPCTALLTGNTIRAYNMANYNAQIPVDGRRVAIVEQTSMCPVVFKNCKLKGSFTGVVVSENCTSDGVVNLSLSILYSHLDVNGDILICHWDVNNYNKVLNVSDVIVWCGRGS